VDVISLACRLFGAELKAEQIYTASENASQGLLQVSQLCRDFVGLYRGMSAYIGSSLRRRAQGRADLHRLRERLPGATTGEARHHRRPTGIYRDSSDFEVGLHPRGIGHCLRDAGWALGALKTVSPCLEVASTVGFSDCRSFISGHPLSASPW
jgi:hypothetical protein